MARSRGLSEAQPSVTDPLTGKHLEDAKTDVKPTKIRILQMPYAGDNITEGYALRATPPATRLSFASALLLSEAAAVYLKSTDFHKILHNLTQIQLTTKQHCVNR